MRKNQIKNLPRLKTKRRKLRRNLTAAEKLLWKCLRKESLGVKFRRQFSIGSYILDFYCPMKKFAIEVDGLHHEEPEEKIYDERRTRFLERMGVKVIRFTNGEVVNDMTGVVERIEDELKAL